MPLYEYVCQDCQSQAELLVPVVGAAGVSEPAEASS